MTTPPTIVVAAHARPESTERLLRAVTAADIEPDTRLVISVDVGRGEAAVAGGRVVELAGGWSWPHGAVEVRTHDGIGLIGHFEICGAMAGEFGSIVLLEDDLLVGPGFHRWATAALEFAASDERIAGVSLAAPGHDGYRRLPFEPVFDGSDGFYAQVPWYDGMAFTGTQWSKLTDGPSPSGVQLHRAFDGLDDDEWFPDLVRRLVAADRQWMLPHVAHATGTGAAGTHFGSSTDWFQVSLATRAPSSFRFVGLDESEAIYDDHMEPTPTMLTRLGVADAADWTIDLKGTRDLSVLDDDAMVLTSRPSADPIASWGASMHPLELNIVHGEPGDALQLATVATVDTAAEGDRRSLDLLRRHHRLVPSRRDALDTLVPGARSAARSLRSRLRRG